jgi:hypothetical protein
MQHMINGAGPMGYELGTEQESGQDERSIDGKALFGNDSYIMDQ